MSIGARWGRAYIPCWPLLSLATFLVSCSQLESFSLRTGAMSRPLAALHTHSSVFTHSLAEQPVELKLCAELAAMPELSRILSSREAAQDYLRAVEDFSKKLLAGEPQAPHLVDTAACLHAWLGHLTQTLDSHPESHFAATKLEVSALLSTLTRTAFALNAPLEKSFAAEGGLARLVQSAKLRAHVATLNQPLPLAAFYDLIKETDLSVDEQHTLLELESHIKDAEGELRYKNPFPELARYAALISTQPSEAKQRLMARVVVGYLLRHGYLFTPRAKNDLLKRYTELIRELERQLRQVPPESDLAKSLSEALALSEREKAEVAAQSFGIRTLLLALNQELSARGLAPETLNLVGMAESFQNEVLNSHFPMGSLRLREGDIWLWVSQNGAGDLFAALAGVPQFVTHSGILASDENEGFRYYFRAEVGDGLETSALEIGQGRFVFVRPTFDVPRGFTAQALTNIAAYKEVLFDIGFEEGFIDARGRAKLYCAEFVHYLYKKQFKHDGPNFPSPFDGVSTHLNIDNPIKRANGERLGFNLAGQFFTPDAFLYSTHVKPVGTLFTEQASTSTDGQKEEFERHMRGVFNDTLGDLFSTRHFTPVTLDERIKVDVFVFWDALKKAKYLRNKSNTNGILPFELPAGQARYYYLRVFRAYAALETALENIRTVDDLGQPIADWKEQFQKVYSDTVLPMLQNAFADAH